MPRDFSFNIYFYFTDLAVSGFSCSTQTRSCSMWGLVPGPGMDGTRAPVLGHRVLASGPSGKSLEETRPISSSPVCGSEVNQGFQGPRAVGVKLARES